MIGRSLPLPITLGDAGSPFGLPFGSGPFPGATFHLSCS